MTVIDGQYKYASISRVKTMESFGAITPARDIQNHKATLSFQSFSVHNCSIRYT